MVVRCPVGVSVSSIVIEVRVCGSNSVGIVKAVLWRVQCNMVRSRSNGEDIMVVQCPVRRLGIVRHDRSCMSEQWATIHRILPYQYSTPLYISSYAIWNSNVDDSSIYLTLFPIITPATSL
jgi:hypothetical protein